MIRKIKVPQLETKRLILRTWKKSDAKDLYSYAKNPAVGPRAGWKPHESEAESRKIIGEVFLQNTVWAIVWKESGAVIGSVGFQEDKFRPGVHSMEMGYSLSEEFWGRGIMTEAALEVLDYGFEYMRLYIISITTGEENTASRRVIEKCGFSYEGMLRKAYKVYDGSIRDIRCYSMFRDEYEKNRGK